MQHRMVLIPYPQKSVTLRFIWFHIEDKIRTLVSNDQRDSLSCINELNILTCWYLKYFVLVELYMLYTTTNLPVIGCFEHMNVISVNKINVLPFFKWSSVQHSTVWYSTVRYSTVRHSTVRCGTVYTTTLWPRSMLLSVVLYLRKSNFCKFGFQFLRLFKSLLSRSKRNFHGRSLNVSTGSHQYFSRKKK